MVKLTSCFILLYRAKAVELIFEKNKSWIDLSGKRAYISGPISLRFVQAADQPLSMFYGCDAVTIEQVKRSTFHPPPHTDREQ